MLRDLRSIELFAGAGGLALGASKAGFRHAAVMELNSHACATIRGNQRRGVAPVKDWPLIEGDVHEISFSDWQDKVDLVAGGPPCQPFSIGGNHRGSQDARNLFPEAVRAVREVRPRAFLFENVKGLLRDSFAHYFEYIILQLTYPEITLKPGQQWIDHLDVLERHHTSGSAKGLAYRVAFRLLNAADYGVPQRRERVFIVGFRTDVAREWAFPIPTHSREALIAAKESGEYWDRHQVPIRQREMAQAPLFRAGRQQCGKSPWRTVRDAISDLPEPVPAGRQPHIQNHTLQPGARPYPGHTGSPLDEPAKTLKAGDHGVPGGENMLAYPDGKVRYFTVRESARLQTFPDDFIFEGSWTENMRQLGNAVPADLGATVAQSVKQVLQSRRS